MATTLPVITTPAPLDLADEALVSGNTTAFLTKMASLMSELTASAEAYRAAIEQVQDVRLSLIEALDADDEALASEIEARGVAIADAITAEVSARNSAINVIVEPVITALTAEEAARVAAGVKHGSEQLNLLPDHGSFVFDDGSNQDYYNRNGAGFNLRCLTDYFGSYNGSALPSATEAGRFYYNSSTHGGSEAANNAIVETFADAMGLLARRYCPTWSVAEFQMGAGTSWTSVFHEGGLYSIPFTSGGVIRGLGVQGTMTISYWVQAVSEPILVPGYSEGDARKTYIDGVRMTNAGGIPEWGAYHKIDVGEIAHICQSVKNTHPNLTTSFVMHCKSGGTVRLASMRAAVGEVQLLPNEWIIRSKD